MSFVKSVSGAVSQQMESVSEINRALTELDKVTQANSAAAEESAANGEDLLRETDLMVEEIDRARALLHGK